ncbi:MULTISPECIES: adenylyl-sulfate kinase [Providencia]|uniref:Adenylyl-sulfate kinase n=1 Tax=Providencia rettgeri TaxID=587 RepID=A0A379FN89_PRORE|nr:MULTISPECIES: adenylyl-sulfate kinase [Providencia]QXB06988.1 adenylyl-sulfate kinase [Providencia rettgeri]SUC30151.1 Adenylyl-sulfate kinase [Providencia rettgeri]
MTKENHIVWHQHAVTRQLRESNNGHKGAVLWFTGLSGSGKSTLAGAIEHQLTSMGMKTYLLDGDNIRHGLCRDLGFNEADRQENIRRVGEVAKLMVDAGLIVATAFISPFQADRQKVRDLFEPEQFFELYVDTPVSICEQRDPKGLYQQAREGKIKQFTGIDSPYEIPQHPELRLDGQQPISDSLSQIIALLLRNHVIQLDY